ncbi:Retrovirus-related Pol polyprotein from transposon TNT 1-94 [Gossypium australe]|uniref:Retrovirus-related Pol polyprotein from transposon TNT 1-94 n=1 Tax=Gossypium australe TaxID=47621 RepID=A0A5B6WMD4_9ROSI|nr:Retrovirus-related Pol polyprotein from transposon TNT 1-94 [Gossypium australe]
MVEPWTYSDAMQNPLWIQAMKEEIQALELNNKWIVVSLAPNKVPIGCKWVYKIKHKATGEVERFKARLVVKRYNQKEGMDYVDTFSPVAKLVFAVRGRIRYGTKKVIMLIYVDDLLLTGNDAVMIDELKIILNSIFKMKDLEELKYFLGFEILRSKEGIC